MFEEVFDRLGGGSAARIAVVFALFGALWILASDQVLLALVRDAESVARWQTAKGWGFVAASAGLIYALVRRERLSRLKTEDLLRDIVGFVPDAVVLRRMSDGVFVDVNEEFQQLSGLSRDRVLGKTLAEAGIAFDPEERRRYEEILGREGEVRNFRLHLRDPGGRDVALLLSSKRIELDGESYRLSVAKDVTELEATRSELEEQLERVESLRNIDLAITGSLELRTVLEVVLEQVTARLGIDAAAILLADSELQNLRFAAGRGFRTTALRHTELAFGESRAGRAAVEREIVEVDDLRESPGEFERSPELEREGFVAYYAVPLLSKGEVVGVLEIFHRESLDPTPSWFSFLEALAGQAAIAIENAALLRNLQDSNRRLRRAYDATIEGWSRAMDLRDRETQGHTERVTLITVKLAREVGVPEDSLVHVRRGALLHDIGKIGIPDAILNKPGPLDDEEWEVMRQHPVLAHRLLAPIDFLRPALDIPYAHHEKWDGSGYPRGLEGEEIPLAARIFAVVDVWDALRSDRPYRDAWSEEKTVGQIRSDAGAHFDPGVVEAFLALHERADLEAMRAEDGGPAA